MIQNFDFTFSGLSHLHFCFFFSDRCPFYLEASIPYRHVGKRKGEKIKRQGMKATQWQPIQIPEFSLFSVVFFKLRRASYSFNLLKSQLNNCSAILNLNDLPKSRVSTVKSMRTKFLQDIYL